MVKIFGNNLYRLAGVVVVILLSWPDVSFNSAVANTATQTRNGCIVNSNGTYYLVQNGVRRGIANPGLLFSHGYDFSEAALATQLDMTIPLGPLLGPGDGALVKKPNDPTVFLVTSGVKHGFVSAEVFTALGYQFSSVLTVTGPELDAVPLGNIIEDSNARHPVGVHVFHNGTIYWMGSTARYGYPSLEVYNSWNLDRDFSRVVPANAADVLVPIGAVVIPRSACAAAAPVNPQIPNTPGEPSDPEEPNVPQEPSTPQEPESPDEPTIPDEPEAPDYSQACTVASLKKKEGEGLRVYSYDKSKYIVNQEDGNGINQVYIANTGSPELICITCNQQAGGPSPQRHKMQPRWHPSGQWIFVAVEREEYSPSILSTPEIIEGMLQSGLWVNMYVVSPNGSTWHRLTDFKSGVAGVADGYTGPAVTSDGKTVVWSQIMDGNILTYYPFGRWEITKAEFVEVDGIPQLRNIKNITPAGMHWNEIGTFHPDNEWLTITGSTEQDAQGMDQYILNVNTGTATNLTNTPTVWDEHGVFSPNGEKVIFMSAYPYRDDPSASKILSIKTEFMLVNRDGSGLTQLTHFRTPGYPEYSWAGGIAANASWSPDGKSVSLRRLFFPDYEDWEITFQGPCGNIPK